MQWIVTIPDKSTYPIQTRQVLMALYTLASVQSNPLFQDDPLFTAWHQQGSPVGTIPTYALKDTLDTDGFQYVYPDGGIAIRAYDLQELAYKYLSLIPVSSTAFAEAMSAILPGADPSEMFYPKFLAKAMNKIFKKRIDDPDSTTIHDVAGNDTGVNYAEFVLLCDIGRNISAVPIKYKKIKAAYGSLGAGVSILQSALAAHAPNPDGNIL